MKRILLLSLGILLVILVVFGVRYRMKNELKKRARQKRELAYQTALHFYSQALLPGTSRKEVEAFLRENKLAFRQACCVDMKEYKKGPLDDLVQIGEEDAHGFATQ